MVDPMSGALEGMLDGQPLNGTTWFNWRANLILDFQDGIRIEMVSFEPSWTGKIEPADFCVNPELESIL